MQEVVASLDEWRERMDGLRRDGRSIGLTMTMGALHRGHASLFMRASSTCDVAVATIFVNPLQFADPDDLARYPRDLDADLAVARDAGVSLVLAPSTAAVWPSWPYPTATTVHVGGLADVLEGADRPGHLDGVAAVVTKLLVATGTCTAFFGEKDYQQLCVVRHLVEDLSLPATIVGCPIVRADDGLAESSRNARLSVEGRAAALALPRALAAGRRALELGGDDATAVREMTDVVVAEPRVALAYAAAVEPATLRRPAALRPGAHLRLLVAGLVDGVRLIDNSDAVAGRP